MTNHSAEVLTLAYALLERLDAADVGTARLIAERILLVLAPLGQVIVTDARGDAALQAERRRAGMQH